MGNGQHVADLGGTRLRLFTYRPQCANPTLLLVFHGISRNADGYRDHARVLADHLCALVVAPEFDKERFPTWTYQRGGIVDQRGNLRPSAEWTGMAAPALVEWAQRQEGRPMAYSMIGHSAGAQFLSRVAAFVPNNARHMVIANPSTWVFPSLNDAAPFGLRGVFPSGETEQALRRYLATPVTVLLGKEDVGDEDLTDNREAVAQGGTRYERGLNVFAAGRDAAKMRGAPFNWQLVQLPGIGHDAASIFAAPRTAAALAR